MKTGLKALAASPIGIVLLGVLVFLPAGTFNYWQGWVFIAVFTLATVIPTLYFARTNPATLQRRLHGGPIAEARTVQKFIIIGAFSGLFAMTAFSAYDHRVGWSKVPTAVCLIGDVLVVAGLSIGMLVIEQNNYAAATVRVEADQKLASRGLYKLVRHPMYAGNLILTVVARLLLGASLHRPGPAGAGLPDPR
jgi:protein-S-isoprenylcysteine O-methyltransferase Ste14